MRNNIRRQLRLDTMADVAIAILSVIDDESLDQLGLNSSTLAGIEEARRGDDTFGLAAAGFCFALTNATLTPQDRLVCSQILALAAACTQRKMVLTKKMLDSENVLMNRAILDNLWQWLLEADKTYTVTGDALEEEVTRIYDYVSQYDRTIKDESREWWKSSATNEDESGNPYPSLLDFLLPKK